MVFVYIRVGVGSLGRDLCRQVRSGSRGFTCERLWDVGFVRVREVSRGGAYAGPFGFVSAHYGAPKGRSVHSSLRAFTRAQHVVVGFAPMSRRVLSGSRFFTRDGLRVRSGSHGFTPPGQESSDSLWFVCYHLVASRNRSVYYSSRWVTTPISLPVNWSLRRFLWARQVRFARVFSGAGVVVFIRVLVGSHGRT